MGLLAVSVDDVISKSTVSGWDIGLAIAALVIAWLAGRFASRGVLRLTAGVDGISDDLRELGARAVKYFCWLLGVGVALSLLGAEVQPLLAAVLIIAVVAVLTIRGVTDNFAAGIVIQTRRPIHIGDEIEALDNNGIVRELNSRAVVIETFDGRTVHLPNAKLLEEPFANHTTVGVRRAEVEVRIEHRGPTDDLRDGLCRSVESVAGVVASRPVGVALVGTDPERAIVVVRFWREPQDVAVITAVVEAITAHLRDQTLTGAVRSPVPPPALAPPPAV